MYYSNTALLCSILPALAGAFVPRQNGLVSIHVARPSSSSTFGQLFMSDDDDDWFAELDSQPQPQQSGGGGGGGGGGRWDALNDYGSSGSFGRSSYGNRGGGGGYGGYGGYGSRGGGRGGRGGGGYNSGPYERDTSRDTSNVDVVAVEALLDERAQYKRQRDYDSADAIRDRLLTEYSVGVNDRERSWRTGCSPGGSGLNGGYGRSRGGGGRGGGRGGRGRRGAPVDFGPNGHDYNPSPDAGENTSNLQDDEIHALLAERLQAKLSRDFNTADGIQAELIENGVYVHDGFKQWRADGVPFETINDRDGGRGRNEDGGRRMRGQRSAYVKSSYSLPYDGDDREITKALEERERKRAQRDFMSADKIRDYLIDELNCFVDDKLREWSIGGDFGDDVNPQRAMSRNMGSRSYVRAHSSQELDDPEEEAFIQQKVDERQQAKFDRDYELADSIRDELLDGYDVVIHDKIRQWSVGGDFGEDSLPVPGVYKRRGGGSLSDEQVDDITALIKERHQAKQDRQYGVADDIRATLLEQYGVTIDDFCNEWRVACDDYIQVKSSSPNARVLSEEEVATVQEQLMKRSAFKKNREYDAADEIRDVLRAQYGVKIDDRTKEWQVGDSDGSSESFVSSDLEDDDFDIDAAILAELGDFDNKGEGKEEEVGEMSLGDNDNEEEETAESDGKILSENDLAKLTVPILKEMLKERGLKVSGKKAELVERLLA